MGARPRDSGFDSTVSFLREGYGFISSRCRKDNTSAFETRLMLRKCICMQGEQAARLFYDEAFFERRNAAPGRIKKTLFGDGGVQGLDDEPFFRRKRMLMSLMTPDAIGRMGGLVFGQFDFFSREWEHLERVVLFDELRKLFSLCGASWAGIQLSPQELEEKAADFASVIDGAGGIGLRYVRARLARKRLDEWAAFLVRSVRQDKIPAAPDSPVYAIAFYREQDGALLNERAAAVELNNILRPSIAMARFAVFSALAMHEHPLVRERLKTGTDEYLEWFVHEVRRFYPFFPCVAARVRRPFKWRGLEFPRGRRVLLDLYGTNHDPLLWESPGEFIPERFKTWNRSPYTFIPQGGGDYQLNHRCPGEWLTIECLKVSAAFLARSITWTAPPQDLSVDLSRMPAQPASGFVMSDIRRLSGERKHRPDKKAKAA